MSIQNLTMLMCLVGLVGPVMLWAQGQVLSRPVAGFMQATQGSSLMIVAVLALASSGWANEAVATYVGCFLMVSASGYWYEGIRRIAGLPSNSPVTRKAIAIYSVGLGVLTFWAGSEKGAVVYNAISCGLVLFLSMKTGLAARKNGNTMLVTALSMGFCGLLFIIFGFGVVASNANSDIQITHYGTVLAICLYLATQITQVGFAVLASDSVQKTLETEATTDYLTGLLNRGELSRRGLIELERCARENKYVGVILLDLDHFKRVNDLYGHQIGDAVIADFATKIKSIVRLYDIAGRYGGEEFVLILPGASEWVAKTIADRIRELATKPSKGVPAYTVSIGVCCGKKGSLAAMINFADKAMYRAKNEGRNRVVVSDYGRDRPPLVLVSKSINATVG